MALKLYFDAMSQPCRSLMIFLKSANIEFVPVLVDIAKGGNQTDEFAKVNPNKRVPAIDDNGFTLTESAAIFQHLCRTRDVEDHWYPSDLRKRAKIDEYLSWHQTNLRMGAAMTFQHTTLRPMFTGKPPNEIEVKRYAKSLSFSLNIMETYFLSNSEYISSEEISIADLLAVTELSQLEVMVNTPALPPKVASWKERCIARTSPHYQDAHKVLEKVKKMVAARAKL